MPSSQVWLSLFCLVFLEILGSHEEEEGRATCTELERCPGLGKDRPWHTNASSLTPHVGGEKREKEKKCECKCRGLQVNLQEKAQKHRWKDAGTSVVEKAKENPRSAGLFFRRAGLSGRRRRAGGAGLYLHGSLLSADISMRHFYNELKKKVFFKKGF